MHKGTNLSKTMLCYTIRQNKSPFEVGATKAESACPNVQDTTNNGEMRGTFKTMNAR